MKKSTHFTLLENLTEVEKWFKEQSKSCTRKITMIQVHHTALPCYKQWPEDALKRQESMRSYHINTRKMGDIAQQLTIFPDGTVATGRSMNTAPAGITGGNTGSVCIEIYGNFDKGEDIMTAEQKKAVIAVYAMFCKYFNIPLSTTGIRAHAWYTSSGTYLGDYIAGKSTKTCPGTNFMGFGNSKSAFVNKFYPLIKEYMESGKIGDSNTPLPEPTKVNITDYTAKVTADSLNVRKGDSTSYDKVTTVKKGVKVKVTHTNSAKTWVYITTEDSKKGWVNKTYLEKVTETPVQTKVNYLVTITEDSLNVRKGPGTSYDKVTTVSKGQVYTIVLEQDGWGLLKAYETNKDGWIKLSYTEKKFQSYIVTIDTTTLNIRKGPGTSYDKVGTAKQGDVVTIVAEQNGWGLLKAYEKNRDGWVSLDYVKKK